MRVLNLYAGIGGNRKLWENVEVTAVEIDPKIAAIYQANFPHDKVVIGDALEYLRENYDQYDFIWSSPKCQSHTRMVKATRHKIKKYPDMSLYQQIIYLQHFCKGKWVVENVIPYYEPLIKPSAKIGRHLFWSNFEISDTSLHSNHNNFIKADSPKEIEEMKNRLGIQYEGNVYYEGNHSPGQILRNAVLPEIGKHVFDCAFRNNNEIEPKINHGLFSE